MNLDFLTSKPWVFFLYCNKTNPTFPGGASGKESTCQYRRHKRRGSVWIFPTQVRSLGQKDPLEEAMATHSSILAWRIPWTEEPGGLQSMKSQRVGHTHKVTLSCKVVPLPKRPCVLTGGAQGDREPCRLMSWPQGAPPLCLHTLQNTCHSPPNFWPLRTTLPNSESHCRLDSEGYRGLDLRHL